MISFLKNGLEYILNGIFPPRCLECRRIGAYLCPKCRELTSAPIRKRDLDALDSIRSGTAYEHPRVAKLVEYFKFHGHAGIATIMAEEIIIPEDMRTWTLVPVPLHWTRKIWRGFNQSAVLARAIGKRYNIPVTTNLKRIKKTAQQARLDREGRLENTQDAFVWTGSRPPECVLLVDDVVATGSTLNSAAQALKKAGVKKVVGITFASG